MYPTYWYSGLNYGGYYHRNRPYGYAPGYAPERRYSSAPSAYRPPPAPRSAPAPVARSMGDVHGRPGWRPAHSRH
jgi:hypothetical protein